MEEIFTLQEDENLIRLDVYLSNKLEMSRSKIQSLIENENIVDSFSRELREAKEENERNFDNIKREGEEVRTGTRSPMTMLDSCPLCIIIIGRARTCPFSRARLASIEAEKVSLSANFPVSASPGACE